MSGSGLSEDLRPAPGHVVTDGGVRRVGESCSIASRWQIRSIVCRCLRGADRSERSISSTTAKTGVSTSGRDRTGGLRGGGIADPRAVFTVRRDTP